MMRFAGRILFLRGWDRKAEEVWPGASIRRPFLPWRAMPKAAGVNLARNVFMSCYFVAVNLGVGKICADAYLRCEGRNKLVLLLEDRYTM
jgi:hypothetical protein